MRVASISDTHIGSPEAQPDKVYNFITHEVPKLSLDKFIIAGDFFDLWLTDLKSAVEDHARIMDSLSSLDSDVVILAGNHDWILANKVPEFFPFEVSATHTFNSGGRDFKAMHGHQFDLTSTDIRNTILSRTNRGASSKLYDLQMDYGIGLMSSIIQKLQMSPFRDKLTRVEKRARRSANEYLVWGHTHTANINEDFVNAGDWTNLQNREAAFIGSEPTDKYALIDDGDVEIVEY